MNFENEMNSLKKELKELNINLKKLSRYNEELKKIIQKQDQFIERKKAHKRLSYIDWLSNERRINSLLSD